MSAAPTLQDAAALTEATTTPFSLSVLTVTKGHASKRLLVGAHGQPIKGHRSLAISAGVLEHVEVAGLAGLKALLMGIRPNQALVHGVVKGSRPTQTAPVVTTEALKQAQPGTFAPETIARSLEHIAYPDGCFLLMFDRDNNPEDPTQVPTAEALFALLTPLLPGLDTAGRLVTTSTSSGIKSKATGEWLLPPTGSHTYLLARGNLARFVDLLKVRLWNADYGYCMLATPNRQTGVASVLTRAVVDLSVFSPERLDYVAGAKIDPRAPFYQDRGDPQLIAGTLFDLDALPAVTPAEQQEYQTRLAAAKAQIAPTRFRMVQDAITAATPTLTPPEVEALAHQRLEQHEGGALPPDYVLHFFHRRKAVAVHELSADYNGLRLADPHEPDYREGTDAIFHWRGGDWLINSFAHGSLRTYQAVPVPPPDPDEEDMQDLLQRAAEDASHRGNGQGAGTEPPDPDTAAPAPSWHDSLNATKGGEVKETFNNLALALEHLSPWSTACWYDLVRDRGMIDTAPLDESQVWRAARAIEQRLTLPIRNLKLVASALRAHCHQHPRDQLKEWLTALPPHDGVARLTEWLNDHAGVPKTAYTMAVARLLPVSMVARALYPGIQCRSVIIFEGAQDIGKSRLVKTLAGEEWYREVSGTLEGKEAHMLMKGTWVVELSEMDVLLRTEESRVKSFITMCNDEYVPKYANDPIKRARRTILVGTINPEGDGSYLRDQTGSTRYYPVRVGTIALADIAACREQLFAEALAWFRVHPTDWWRMPNDAADELLLTREARRKEGVYEGPRLQEWLAKVQAGATEVLAPFHTEDALRFCFNIPPERWTAAIKDQVGKAIGKAGWISKTSRARGTPQRLWHVEA
jgi:predicted P-loop ATPase